jgi:hypothetical protein
MVPLDDDDEKRVEEHDDDNDDERYSSSRRDRRDEHTTVALEGESAADNDDDNEGAIDVAESANTDITEENESSPTAEAAAAAARRRVSVETSASFVKRLAFQFVLLLAAGVCYMLMFAGPGIGFGADVRFRFSFFFFFLSVFFMRYFFFFFLVFQLIRFVVEYEVLVDEFVIVGASIMLLMYITDFSHWTGHWKKLKKALLAVVFLALTFAALVASKLVPGAAIAVYVLVLPCFIWLVKYVFYKPLHPALFARSMGIALLAISAISATVWVGWVFYNNYVWTRETKILFNQFVDCQNNTLVAPTTTTTTTTAATAAVNVTLTTMESSLTTIEMATTMATTVLDSSVANGTTASASASYDDDVSTCLVAWMVWASPLLGACNAFVFGLLALLLARTFREGDQQPLTMALKLFIGAMAMAAVCLWVAAAIAGAGLGINSAVQYLVGVTILVATGTMVTTIGWQRLTEYLMAVPLIKKLTASLLTDWFKALFVLFLMPVFPVYFCASFLNQMVRRCISFGYRIDDPKERRLWLTLAAAIQFKMLKRWRWTSVLTKVMWIGLFYVIVQVGIGLLVTVFMSWLNDVLQDLPLYATTIIFFLIGVIMFLLPPVPGLPVFLTGGILLGKAGEPVFTFFGAIAYASAVCWVCKMFSLFLQQKAIGQGMSGSLYIRKTVGINSITIRAIRRLLRKPGLSMPKVMILIGGPDWPTSVLTGILRMSWIQMQIGTAPIIFLIIPMVGSGAFLLKTNEGGLWGPVSDVTIAVAALTQIIAILLAMYYISETAEQNYDELRNEPDDEEVAAAERAEAETLALKLARQSWFADDFPWWMRVLLVLGAISITICVYVLIVADELAFVPFSLTDNVAEKLDNNILNLVLVWGWVCIGLTTFTTLVLVILGRWTKYRLAHLPPGFQIPQSILNQLHPPPPPTSAATAHRGAGWRRARPSGRRRRVARRGGAGRLDSSPRGAARRAQNERRRSGTHHRRHVDAATGSGGGGGGARRQGAKEGARTLVNRDRHRRTAP